MKKIFLIILLFSFFNAYAEESSLIESIKDDSSVDCRLQVKQNSAQKTAELFIIQIYVQKSIKQKQKIFKKLILNFVK